MAYLPPTGSSVDTAFSGVYVAPDGGAITFAWPYASPPGDRLDFDFSEPYTPPLGDAILFSFGVGTPVDPPPEPVPAPAKPDFNVPWGRFPVRDNNTAGGWTSTRPVSRTIRQGWLKLLLVQQETGSAWGQPDPKNTQKQSSWSDCKGRYGKSSRSPWRNLGASDKSRRFKWDRQDGRDSSTIVYWHSPPRRYERFALAWDRERHLDRGFFELPWGNPPPKDRHHRTLWGRKYYEEICWRRYEPPNGGNLDFSLSLLLSHVDDGDNIRFRFDQFTYDRRCRHREPSGWRDAYFYVQPPPIPYGIFKRCYFMLNQALLTRLPERTPVDVSSITLATDIDSFCWSMSATVNSASSLELFQTGSPVTVEASINGWLFNILVDRWNRGRRFAGASRTIAGRSLSANLAAPFAPSISTSESTESLAQQLAAKVLSEAALAGVSGWSLDWDIVDWLVPGGLWSVADAAPIEAIQDIAGVGGGFVQTHRTDKQLLILPRYGVMPWSWASATPAVIIPEAMVLSEDGSWEPKIQFNAAFVSGTADGGISAKVVRNGSAGDAPAPMFTHALMTDTDAALAKGRVILAQSGDWERVTISIPLFQNGTQPGLVLPGTLVQMTNGSVSWNGQVIGTSVTASRVRGGVVVRQSLTIERYHGD